MRDYRDWSMSDRDTYMKMMGFLQVGGEWMDDTIDGCLDYAVERHADPSAPVLVTVLLSDPAESEWMEKWTRELPNWRAFVAWYNDEKSELLPTDADKAWTLPRSFFPPLEIAQR